MKKESCLININKLFFVIIIFAVFLTINIKFGGAYSYIGSYGDLGYYTTAPQGNWQLAGYISFYGSSGFTVVDQTTGAQVSPVGVYIYSPIEEGGTGGGTGSLEGVGPGAGYSCSIPMPECPPMPLSNPDFSYGGCPCRCTDPNQYVFKGYCVKKQCDSTSDCSVSLEACRKAECLLGTEGYKVCQNIIVPDGTRCSYVDYYGKNGEIIINGSIQGECYSGLCCLPLNSCDNAKVVNGQCVHTPMTNGEECDKSYQCIAEKVSGGIAQKVYKTSGKCDTNGKCDHTQDSSSRVLVEDCSKGGTAGDCGFCDPFGTESKPEYCTDNFPKTLFISGSPISCSYSNLTYEEMDSILNAMGLNVAGIKFYTIKRCSWSNTKPLTNSPVDCKNYKMICDSNSNCVPEPQCLRCNGDVCDQNGKGSLCDINDPFNCVSGIKFSHLECNYDIIGQPECRSVLTPGKDLCIYNSDCINNYNRVCSPSNNENKTYTYGKCECTGCNNTNPCPTGYHCDNKACVENDAAPLTKALCQGEKYYDSVDKICKCPDGTSEKNGNCMPIVGGFPSLFTSPIKAFLELLGIQAVVCGDGVCDQANAENCGTCVVDCPCPRGYTCSHPVCVPICNNNGVCDPGEDTTNCPAECPATPPAPVTCGNGVCDAGEDTTSCCLDCGCLSGTECIGGTCIHTAPVTCGNGVCDAGETCSSCSVDCGTCPVTPPTTGGGGGGSCFPKTCAELGIQCGPVDDGCGGSIVCGTCEAGQTCDSNGQCICKKCPSGQILNQNGNCICRDQKNAYLLKYSNGNILCVCADNRLTIDTNTGMCESADPNKILDNGKLTCKNGLKNSDCTPKGPMPVSCLVKYEVNAFDACGIKIKCEEGTTSCCAPILPLLAPRYGQCTPSVPPYLETVFPYQPITLSEPESNIINPGFYQCGLKQDGCGKWNDFGNCNIPDEYKCIKDENGNPAIDEKIYFCDSGKNVFSEKKISCPVCTGCGTLGGSFSTTPLSCTPVDEGTDCQISEGCDKGSCGTCQKDSNNIMKCVKKIKCCEDISYCQTIPDPANPSVLTEQSVTLVYANKKDVAGNCIYNEQKGTICSSTCQTCYPQACGNDEDLTICNNPKNPQIKAVCDRNAGDGDVTYVSKSPLSCQDKTEGESCNWAIGLTSEAEDALRFKGLTVPSYPRGSEAHSTGRSRPIAAISNAVTQNQNPLTAAVISPITGNAVYSALSEDNYVLSKDNIGISGNYNWTISTWIYPMSNPDYLGLGAVVLGFGNKGNKQGIVMYYNSNKKAFQLGVTGTGNNIDVSSYVENNWYNVIESYNGTDIVVYINNIKAGSKKINSLAITNTKLYIGVDPFYENRYFNGSVGETKIWNYALNENELSAEYKAGDVYPALYYPFDGDALDYSGNMNDGTIINGASFVSGKKGLAINLNGNQYVNLSAADDLALGNEITISAWVKPTLCNGGIIIKRGLNNIGNNYIEYSLNIGSNAIWFELGNSSNGYTGLTGTFNACDNKWHHVVALLRNNNIMEIWADGKFISSKGKSFNGSFDYYSTIATPVEYVGRIATSSNLGVFNGQIDELKVWKYALNPSEILQEYQKTAANKNLILYYSFDENSYSNTTKDYSGYGNDGNLNKNPMQTYGKIGNAYSFDWNSNNFIFSSQPVNAILKNPWSVSAWVYPIKSKTTAGILGWGLLTANNNQANYIRYNHPGKRFEFGFNNVIWKYFSGYPEENWYYVVETYNGTNIKIYINNVLMTSENPGSLILFPGKLFIGSWLGLTGTTFNGTIDEVKMWNYALNEKEVSQEYARGVNGLSLYYPFDGDINDYSGLGNDAIYTRDISKDFSPGKKGKASFYLIGNMMSINNSYNLELGDEITISSWVAFTSLPRTNNTIIKRGIINSNDEKNQEYVLYGETGSDGMVTINFIVGNSVTSNKVKSIVKVPRNSWNHVAVILRKNNKIEIYINGKLSGSGTKTITGSVNVYDSSSSSNLDSSLVSLWRMDDLNSSGGVVDYTGRNNGSVLNGATWTSNGKYGGAYQFDGINDWINIPNSNSLNPTSQITLSGWFKQNIAHTGMILSKKHEAQYRVYVDSDDSIHAGLTIGGNVVRVSASGLGTTWHKFDVVYNSTSLMLYLDGILKNKVDASGNIATTTDNFQIGTQQSGYYNFNGTIDEVRIWNRSLNSSEILSLYNPNIINDGMLVGQRSNIQNKQDYLYGYMDELKVWKYALSATEILDEYNNGNRDLKCYYPFQGDYLDYSGNMNDANLMSSSGGILGSEKFDMIGGLKNLWEWLKGLFK